MSNQLEPDWPSFDDIDARVKKLDSQGLLQRTPWFPCFSGCEVVKPVHKGMYLCRSVKEKPNAVLTPRVIEVWTWRYWNGADWHYGLQCKVIKSPWTFKGLGTPCPDVDPRVPMAGVLLPRDLWDFEWCGINESPEIRARCGV